MRGLVPTVHSTTVVLCPYTLPSLEMRRLDVPLAQFGLVGNGPAIDLGACTILRDGARFRYLGWSSPGCFRVALSRPTGGLGLFSAQCGFDLTVGRRLLCGCSGLVLLVGGLSPSGLRTR